MSMNPMFIAQTHKQSVVLGSLFINYRYDLINNVDSFSQSDLASNYCFIRVGMKFNLKYLP